MLRAALLCLALLPAAAPAPAGEHAEPPVPVLATVGMIADIAAQVGGDCARVETLIGPGADPHLFTPAPSDIGRFERARVILYAGLHLEGRLGDILARLGEHRVTVAVSEGAVPPAMRLMAGDMPDPHVWMAPGLWRGTVEVIAAALTRERPACAGAIAAAAARTAAKIDALDAWAAASVATIPPGQRHLVTAHDAFAYFGRAYGLEVSAIQGISTASEAAIADIDAVAALVAEQHVPAVFVESTVNPRTIAALTEAAAARGARVAIGGTLYSDAMGAEGTPGGSYAGMIRHNVEAIVTALGGTPAPFPPGIAP